MNHRINITQLLCLFALNIFSMYAGADGTYSFLSAIINGLNAYTIILYIVLNWDKPTRKDKALNPYEDLIYNGKKWNDSTFFNAVLYRLEDRIVERIERIKK